MRLYLSFESHTMKLSWCTYCQINR